MIHHDLVEPLIEGLWHGAVVAVPTAILAGGIIAIFRPRPATRHVLWVAVLCSFLMPLAAISITREAPALASRALPANRAHDAAPPSPTQLAFSPELGTPHAADLAPELPIEPLAPSALTQATSSTDTDAFETLAPRDPTPFIAEADATDSTGHRPGGPRSDPYIPSADHTVTLHHALDRTPAISNSTTAVLDDSRPATLPARIRTAPQRSAPDPEVVVPFPAEPPTPTTLVIAEPNMSPAAAAREWALTTASSALELASDRAFAAVGAVQSRAGKVARAGSDAFASIPRMPSWLWLSGICVIVFIAIVRLYGFGRVLRNAHPAPAEVRAMVAQAADAIDLRRRPLTVMSDQRISPLVWCGLGPTMVLPSNLWHGLDADSRRAIVVHELAHLKRHDHWVGWLALIIGIAFWWHPVVWWARRRLAEEADLCCDAWVVSTLPSSRRAYAEALVTTRSFLAAPGRGVPAMGLGVMSKRARKLARRLAMIMTKKAAPRASLQGGALALALIGVSGLLGPAIACPPEEKAISTTGVLLQPDRIPTVTVQGLPSAPHVVVHGGLLSTTTVAPAAPRDPAALPTPAQPVDSTFEHHMQGGRFGQAEDRFEHLNQRLARLEEVLAQLDARLAGDPAISHGFGITTPAPDMWLGDAASQAKGVIARTYTIPQGRLDALVELMKRDDVPIYVSWDDATITVNATDAQHEIFSAFCTIICPEGVTVRDEDGNPVSMGFMFDDDAFAAIPAAVAAAAAACEAECEAECEADCEAECEAERKAAAEHDHAAHNHAAIEQYRARSDLYRVKAQEYRAQHLAMLEEANALAAHADEIEAATEDITERVDELREAAEELTERAAELEGAEARDLRAEARALESEARRLEREARNLAREAERARQRAEKAENQADELESRADELLDHADEIAAELDSMIEIVPTSTGGSR